ncbi:MAG: hypothetical protein AAFN50_11650 [Pseudomonadota bacterium]
MIDVDMPWFNCKFLPTSDFSQFAHLFENELALLNADEMEKWETAYDEIDALGLKLVPTDADAADLIDLILHVEGSKAWFRL